MGVKNALQLLFILAALLISGVRASEPATRASEIAVLDDAGVVHHPLDTHDAAATVIIFIGVDCPVSNTYAPLINRLCEEFRASKVRFFLVHSDTHLSDEDARKHAHAFGYSCTILMDRRHELAAAVGATITPEAAVIGPDGHLEYRGRIDDRYISLGRQRYEPTTHELRDAISAVLEGKKVTAARTQSVGCTIGQ